MIITLVVDLDTNFHELHDQVKLRLTVPHTWKSLQHDFKVNNGHYFQDALPCHGFMNVYGSSC